MTRPGAAVAGLRLTVKTALYDGVLGALEAAGPDGEEAGQRKILVLSDGKDTTTTPLKSVVSQIKKSGAVVDVVSLQEGDEANTPLNAIAAAGKGTVLTTADPAALTAAFAEQADALARQVVVTADVPDTIDQTSSNVSVSVPTADETFTAAAYVPVRTAKDLAATKTASIAPQPVSAGPFALSQNVMYGAVGAMAIGMLGLILVVATGGKKVATNLTLTEQIQAYGVMAVPGESGPRRDTTATNAFSGQARQVAEKALANNKNLEARIALSLEGSRHGFASGRMAPHARRHRSGRLPDRGARQLRQHHLRRPVRHRRPDRPVRSTCAGSVRRG